MRDRRIIAVDAWDSAAAMCAATGSRTRSRGNVRVVDLAPGACPPGELYDAILGGALVDGAAEVWRYAKGRASQPLLHLTCAELASLARAAGFATTVLASNLTHRQKRFTAVLRPA